MRIEQRMKQAEQMHEQLHQPGPDDNRGRSGGGIVTVAMNGLEQRHAITIEPEIVSRDDVEFLQDLVVVAVINDAHRKVDEETGEKTGALLRSPLLPRMVQ